MVVESKCRDLEFVQKLGRGGVASTLRSLPRRRPASSSSVESDLGGGIDPKLRMESGTSVPAAKLKSRGTSKSAASRHAREPDDADVIFQNHDPTFFINMPPGSKAYPIINTTTSSDL